MKKIRMKTVLAVSVFLCILFSLPATSEVEGCSGVINFRDGSSVQFTKIGTKSALYPGAVVGKIGMQDVKYTFSELQSILFADETKNYDGDGDLIVIHKNGTKFTLSNAGVGFDSSSTGYIRYIYPDPISGELKEAQMNIRGKILGIEIGADKGVLKFNSQTGQYFPACYIFDPFTGEKLIWATPK